MKAEQLTELTGKTPLLHLEKMHPAVWGKLEYKNPLGSVKDRAAYYMIKDALDAGTITRETTVVEATSGNTGIALSYICAELGMDIVLTMPESMSVERRKLLSALGAQLVLTPAAKGMSGAVERAKEVCAERGGWLAGQFDNPSNPRAHRETTGPELLADMPDVDIFVAGVGTGGTITGCGEFLKARKPDVKIVAVEPAESPVLSGGTPGPHKIQGIGAGFVPGVLNRAVIDEIIRITGAEAIETGRVLGREMGLLCGISSGAALCAAVKLAERPENAGKKIAVILPDTGERYLSTELFG